MLIGAISTFDDRRIIPVQTRTLRGLSPQHAAANANQRPERPLIRSCVDAAVIYVGFVLLVAALFAAHVLLWDGGADG
jgi:hypothetical protein